MSLLRINVSTRCSGDKDPQCQKFINKTSLPTHKRHCPDCGSSLTEDTKPNVPVIVVLVSALVVSVGGIGYLVWQKLGTTVTTSPPPTVPISTPAPTVKANPKPTKTPATDPSISANPTPTSTPIPSTTTSTPKSKPVSPVRFPPPPPTKQEIETAILKLKKMNPNELLEFPVEEKPDSYRVIGIKDSKGADWYWTAQTVQDFLQESLQQGGKFSETNNEVSLVVRNQSTGKEERNVPIDKNELLARFVRSITVMK